MKPCLIYEGLICYYRFLYTESKLTEFDACVKLKMRDSMDEWLKKANELLKLDFKPLMFKKNPQVVETIRKVHCHLLLIYIYEFR